jgi:hypothetical protein
VLTLAIFHTPQSLAKVAQKIDEGMDVPRRLTGKENVFSKVSRSKYALRKRKRKLRMCFGLRVINSNVSGVL